MKKVLKCLGTIMLGLFTVSCTGGGATNTSGNATNNGDKITITVQAEKTWIPHYEKAAQRVEEKFPNSDVVVVEQGAFTIFDIIDSTDVTNSDVTDIYAVPADRIASMYTKDALAEIDAVTLANEIGGWKDFENGLASSFKIDGKYFAFPMNIETLIVFANTKNAESRGIDLTQPIEFSTLAYDDMLIAPWDLWFGVSFLNANDITPLSKDENGVFYSDLTKDFKDLPKDVQDLFTTLFNYWKQHEENKTDLWDKSATWSYIEEKFKDETSFRLDGPWSTVTLVESLGGFENLDVIPISKVTINGKPLEHWKSGWGLAINPRIEGNAQAMEVALEMIKEIVNPEYAIDLFKSTGKILENVSPEDYQNSDLNDLDKKVIASVLESYENASQRPTFNEWSEVWGTWENAILSWSSTKPKTAEEAYESVQSSFKSMLSTLK